MSRRVSDGIDYMQLCRRTLLALAGTAAIATAHAAVPMTRMRGQIVSVDAGSMVMTSRTGDTVRLVLSPDVLITEIAPIAVSAIKPGAFIGTAAVTQADGTLKALEVQVFPESMRGVGEGHRPWDLAPNSTMTNGTVGDLKVADGRTLTLTYKGGEQHVFVPPSAPVITFYPGSRSLLQPNAQVIVSAAQDAHGDLIAQRIGVGKNGMAPPM